VAKRKAGTEKKKDSPQELREDEILIDSQYLSNPSIAEVNREINIYEAYDNAQATYENVQQAKVELKLSKLRKDEGEIKTAQRQLEKAEKEFHLAQARLELTVPQIPPKEHMAAIEGRKSLDDFLRHLTLVDVCSEPVVATEQRKQTKRARPEDVTTRIGLVKAVAAANPSMKGRSLDLLTCQELDARRVPVSEQWKINYRITSWEEGYDHPKVKGLIHKMFSTDRKKPL